MKLYPHQEKFLKDNPDHAILCYETGCLHPDSQIEDAFTGAKMTIKQWSELGWGFYVKAYDTSSRKFVFAKANPPVAYTKDDFYRFHFAGGDEVCVTPQHRFLVSKNHGGIWKTAQELHDYYVSRQKKLEQWPIFLRPFVTFLYPHPTIVGTGPSWLPQGALRWMNKVGDYLCRCSNHCRQYDPPLHRVSSNDQDVLPSPGDVLELYSVYSGKDDLGYRLVGNWYNQGSSQYKHHLSKKHSYRQSCNMMHYDPLPQFFLSGSVLYESQHRIVLLFGKGLDQIRKVLSIFVHRVLLSLNNSTKNVQVWKVDTLETQDVYYDFHVPKYENYVLGGVVNHNCGKSHVAKLWMHLGTRRKNPVVICPKQIVSDWKDSGATVYSFEQFKKAYQERTLPEPTAIIVDEADGMASPLFVAKSRSQRTEALYEYVMDNPQAHILLLSATPVRSTPWNMHTLLVLARLVSPETWKSYREKYFALTNMPYLPRPAWIPRQGWQKMMPALIERYTYTALMSDLVDLPPETHEIIKLKEPDYEENDEWEPAKQFSEDHRLEQRGKDKKIKEITKGFRKAVIVCRYREQIDDLKKSLSRERATLVLDGRTKDVGAVVAEAEALSECYLIIQAQVGAGFELPSFAVMIFASQSYGARDYTQMKGRIKRINALKPLKYFYLQAGRCDRMVYNAVKKGLDFIPAAYKATEENE